LERHSVLRLPPHLSPGSAGVCYDRNSVYLSNGTQSSADVCTPLVVPKPLPRHARKAAMPGLHQFVN
jgi:hypothetical protein